MMTGYYLVCKETLKRYLLYKKATLTLNLSKAYLQFSYFALQSLQYILNNK